MRTFLDCSGSWVKAAAPAQQHGRRVEELTGRDLNHSAPDDHCFGVQKDIPRPSTHRNSDHGRRRPLAVAAVGRLPVDVATSLARSTPQVISAEPEGNRPG